MMGTILLRVSFLFTVTLLVSSNFLYAATDPKKLYDQAVQLEEALKKSGDKQKQISEWKKVVEAYRKVYYNHPASGYCDNSLFHVGALYAEMGRRFEDDFYLHRACSTFEFLIDQYNSSSLVEEAMLEYVRIMRDELKKENELAIMEERFRKRAPKMAATVLKESNATATQPASLKTLRHYTGADYTRVVLDFDKEVSFKRNRLMNPDRLYLDFDNTVAYKDLLDQEFSVDDGFLKRVRVGQNTYRKARVVLDLKSIENFEIFSLYHPYRVVIDIQGTKTAEVVQQPMTPVVIPEKHKAEENSPTSTPTQTSPEMAKANTSGQYSLARQLGLKVRRIVVDAGHGGHDPGAMRSGLKEKDITLDVAKKLKNILEEEYGYEVLMTRSDDDYVALEERTAFANSNSADLFVSVHVNSSRNKKAKGIETYYLNFATTPEAMEVAARENAISEKNMGELQKLTTAIALNTKIEESRDFAKLIQTNLVGHLQKGYAPNNLGVKQAPFYVLIGAQMPSILAEISFISNEREFNLLETSSYRHSLAQGLARGVHSYVETLAESRLTKNLPAE
ncbi:MAG TPA: N-acetylmuramoyl-L-alanine amidase [Acidobacteriota bacterium]|nr:N-acetylmuramoyl-L-alanine amidase [Acidobacteriota bacterium]